ncbi:GNAT family N-acetyltransferase [Ferrimonas balearica]|uniref:GNAT family N-acetyltransferase n=1 Tax=Ferrimonas balearica TaxID=44012 RepID=UPI001C582830|nr:GNAT family N-acetyltransferase [Ferrimonas balearica]MBW3138562.1 GNAT family N-acetyltransferase [Ferrimonas balearica]MBY6105623.1 GNAT family N-acetyltransferase [Ferrimonas balearica]
MLQLRSCPATELSIDLLLEADPDIRQVERYLNAGLGFAAELDGKVVGVAVVVLGEGGEAELMNIAIEPARQATGLGSQLLAYVIEQARAQGIRQLGLGTGTFGHQLRFYQRQGFRVVAVERDHFLTHYPEPIFEDGIQHKDRLWLELTL